MNPNLTIFFKRSVYVLIFAGIAAALYFGIKNYTAIDLALIGEYIMYGFLGLMMAFMIVLIVGVTFQSLWTGIMNRADSIELCCPDKNHKGAHIVASHYNPGGESGEGFSSYFHYYLDESGKLYLSKKVAKEGRDIESSIKHLSAQTGVELEPDRERAVSVGSNTDGDNKPTDVTLQLRKGELHFRGYQGMIDYGFRITRRIKGESKWVVRI